MHLLTPMLSGFEILNDLTSIGDFRRYFEIERYSHMKNFLK